MVFLRKSAPVVFLFLIIVLVYWDLPKTFFQQDEWYGFGKLIFQEATGGSRSVLISPFLVGKGHFMPLSFFQFFLEFKLFGLAFEPYAYASIATHIVSSLLLFYFVYLLLKNKFLAFCSSLFFAVGVISNQAITWIGSSPNTQGAVLFTILSLIFILKYLQNNQKISYYIALVFFFIGLLFKETILFLFILVPLMWFLFGQKKGKKHFFLFLKPLAILGFIYILIRASLLLIRRPDVIQNSNAINQSFIPDIMRLITIPFKLLPQAIIPQQYLINISDLATILFYPEHVFNGFANPYFSQTVVFGKVIPYLSIPILLVGFIVYKYFIWKKEIILSKAVVFSLSLVVLSALPLVFIPGKEADFPIYESRHLHVGTIGVSIFLVLVVYSAVKFFLKKDKYVYILLLLVLMPLLLMHFYLTRMEVEKVVRMSTARKYILESIIRSYPELPGKVVFYTESDTAYYGMPIEEKALPVQINIGLILLIWYSESENFPPCLFDFRPQAYHMLTQQYKECGGRGFGYFRDYDKLINAIKENNLFPQNVIAHSWRGKSGELKDITDQTRAKIKKDL